LDERDKRVCYNVLKEGRMYSYGGQMDHRNRFDGKGEIYAKARPQYEAGLFNYLKDTLRIVEGSIFADIGSGTGIFTEQLLNCGYKVYAVEPNNDMRKKAEERLSQNQNFVSVEGNASNMNLPDRTVDVITAAQAFHWFDPEGFRRECRRILKPGGKVILVYNSRNEGAACTEALARLRRKYNAEFHGFSNGIKEEECTAFFTKIYGVYRADNTQSYDREGYINRVLSSSYSLKEKDEGYKEYLREINEIFDQFSINHHISVPTETIAFIGDIY